MDNWFKERLDKEKQRKESDDSRIYNSYQLYALICLINLYGISKVDNLYTMQNGLPVLFAIFSMIFWLASIIYWIKSYYNHNYRKEIMPSDLKKYRDDLLNDGRPMSYINREIDDLIKESIYETLEKLIEINNKRATQFFNANYLLSFSFLLSVLHIILLYLLKLF